MILIQTIVILIAVKYLLLSFGYSICFIITSKTFRQLIVKRKATKNENASADKAVQPGFLSRVLNGWLRYSLMCTGRIPSHFIRSILYKKVYHVQLGKKVVVHGGAEIRAPYNVEIGTGTIIGDNAILDGRNGIVIGKNVNLSTGVWIWTEQHDVQSPHFSCNNQGGRVTIGDRVWISGRAIILPGVTIGEGAVVAAGAVVTKDVEPFSIYGGVPAKKIGERNKDLVYEFDGKPLAFY